MIDALFPSYPLPQDIVDDLLAAIQRDRAFWGPCSGADGVWRLHPLSEGLLPDAAVRTFLPIKKLLLPDRAALWSHSLDGYRKAGSSSPIAVVGVPLCELQAVWYLDQVFAEDETYLARRKQLLLVGMTCEPGAECRCSRQLMPVSGDLFVTTDRVWALSRSGQGLLLECACGAAEEMPLPWPEGLDVKRTQISEELYLSSVDANIWLDQSQHCLSCGACSAVCPTCYCFDLMDAAALDGSVVRRRAWDNCFLLNMVRSLEAMTFARGGLTGCVSAWNTSSSVSVTSAARTLVSAAGAVAGPARSKSISIVLPNSFTRRSVHDA